MNRGPRHRTLLRRYVLDANALTGFLEARTGLVERVARLITEAFQSDSPLLMSAVNWGEVFYIAYRRHGEIKAREAEARLRQLPVVVIAGDQDRATRAGALKVKHGLGYADAFAAELAIEQHASLVTADPEFAKMGKLLSILALPRHEK